MKFGIHAPLGNILVVILIFGCFCNKLFNPYFTKKYSIPLDLFDKKKGVEPYLKQLDYVFFVRTPALNVVNRFEDERFDTILFVCTSFKCLHSHYSFSLVNAKHAVSHMKLKCLEIFICIGLEKLETLRVQEFAIF
ncbi:hypothetical protein PVK06_041764 [Gossypium arboreum]|uniref:Uncharacterized protein n=1 Tax=Gossypium arboreum TaxID=29729 RepID=A0ABR0NA21_GOSAR|nr:hypothetical protein PVK06_041764 [Gossypium arboreum]